MSADDEGRPRSGLPNRAATERTLAVVGTPSPPERPLSIVPDDEQHDAAEHSKLVMDAMRHIADQQFDRAERVRLGARQTFLYVSALFTIGQAAAFTNFGVKTAAGTPTV